MHSSKMVWSALLSFTVLTPVVLAAPQPIVGILSVPIDHTDCITLRSAFSNGTSTSCFTILYVKWLEAAGVRVAPIRFDLPAADLQRLLSSLNGALITGGEYDIVTPVPSQYLRSAKVIYDFSRLRHKAGEVWPLWGTCMGLQTLSILAAGTPSVLLPAAYKTDLLLPLTLTAAAKSSQMLCKGSQCLPLAARETLTTRNVTVYLNHDGVPPAAFVNRSSADGKSRLGRAFSMLSYGTDRNGRTFASTIEASDGAPIWATQWHPERPQFQWGDAAAAPWGDFFDHGAEAVAAMWSVAAFFVRHTRLNSRHFPTREDEERALIYNYRPVGDNSYQTFFFEP